ncbi:hypothetical protein [Streptomyces sp. NPDC050504]|uniref:hypothetical protein n=1 Tax=Streptomyces sp. NPDC050504 TaxID=3365618 RepID=UPI0037B509FB
MTTPSSAPRDSWEGRVTAGPGGAMTDEVGVVTGDLTLRTTPVDGGRARFLVQYTGADEWYELTGSPSPVPDGSTPRDLHEAALRAIAEGGPAHAPGHTPEG